MQNYQQLEKIYESAGNSAGSAQKEQESYMDSIEGRMNAFTETVKKLWISIISSDSVKTTLSGLTSIVSGIDGVINAFGVLPSAIASAIAVMTIFNSKFRASMTIYQLPIVATVTNGMAKITASLSQTITTVETKIKAYKRVINIMNLSNNNTATSFAKSRTALLLYQTKLGVVTIATNALKVASIALGTAMNMALGMGIGYAIEGIMNLIKAQDNLQRKNQEYTQSLQDSNNTGGSQVLLNNYKKLQSELSNLQKGTDAYKAKEEELASVQQQLIDLYPQASTVIDENTGKKKLNADATQDLIDKDKELAEARAIGIMGDNKIDNNDDIDKLVKKYQDSYDKMMKIKDDFNNKKTKQVVVDGEKFNIGVTQKDVDKATDAYEKQKDKIYSTQGALSILGSENVRYKGGLDKVNNALNSNTELSEISQTQIMNMANAMQSLNDNEELSDDTINSLVKTFPTLGLETNNASENIKSFNSALISNADVIKSASEELDSLTDGESLAKDTINNLAQAFPNLDITSKNAGVQVKNLKAILQSLQSITPDPITLMSDALNELDANSIISSKTVNKLIKVFPDLIANSDDATSEVKKFGKQLNENSKIVNDAKGELNKLGEGGKLSEETIRKLSTAFSSLGINSDNATSMLANLVRIEGDIADKAKIAEDAIKSLADEFSKLGDEAKIIDTMQKDLADYGGLTEDTLGAVISKYPELLAVMSQEGDMSENLSKKQSELREAQQAKYEEAIIMANDTASVEAQAQLDSATAKINADAEKNQSDADYNNAVQSNASNTSSVQQEADINSTNANADAIGVKTANDVDYNVAVQTNASATTTKQNEEYKSDVTNNDNANQKKQANNSAWLNALNVGLADWMVQSNNKYISDLGNWIVAIRNKVSWWNWFKQNTQEDNDTTDDTPIVKDNKTDSDEDKAKKEQEEKAKEMADREAKAQEAKAKAQKLLANVPKIITTKQASTMDAQAKEAEASAKKAQSEAKKAMEKAQKLSEEISKMESDIKPDRYQKWNDALTLVNNALKDNETLQESLSGSALQKAINEEIELYGKKQKALKDLYNEEVKEKDELKAYLEQYDFAFDANGQITNSKEKIEEWEAITNAMTGDTDEAKEKKQEWIDWIKLLNDYTKKYANTVNNEMPDIINQWNELNNTIKKTAINQLTTVRDDLVDALKEKIKKAQEAEEKANEKAKNASIDKLDSKINKLKKELANLEDDSDDKTSRLSKLKEQLKLWQQDDSALSGKKQSELSEKIAELEKQIQKDSLNDQIDTLEAKKESVNKHYDKIEKATKDSYDKQLSDEKLYTKANQLLQDRNLTEIEALLEGHSEKWKEIGNILGTSLGDSASEAISSKVKSALNAIDTLNDSYSGKTGSSYNDFGGSHSKDSSGLKGQLNLNDLEEGKQYTGTTTSGRKYYINKNGDVVSYGEGGYYDDEELRDIQSHIARYETGGRVGSNGGLAILDPKEKILNKDDTVMTDRIYSYVKDTVGVLDAVSDMLGNYDAVNSIANTSNIANNVSNSTTNQGSVSIKNEFHVTNESNVQARSTEQNIAKLIKDNVGKYGRRI